MEANDNDAAWHCDVALAQGDMSCLLARVCGAAFILGPELRAASTAHLLPITTAFLLVAVAALGFRARQRRGYRPMLLGMVASAVVLFGKFSLDSSAVMYVGLIVINTASVWNSWPRGERQQVLCPQCAPEGKELIQLSAQEKSQ
jgi:hypothetical protein